jgi:hypothetical protein
MQVLEIIGRQLLVRKDELKTLLRKEGFENGAGITGRLMELGYVQCVEAVGSPCYAITQSGLRALEGK